MQALRLLMLVVVLALAYLLVLRPQTKMDDQSPNLVQTNPAPEVASGMSPAQTARPVHSQYKEAMDRAHEAARQMQAQRAEANSF